MAEKLIAKQLISIFLLHFSAHTFPGGVVAWATDNHTPPCGEARLVLELSILGRDAGGTT
jgi:hypothetical protein